MVGPLTKVYIYLKVRKVQKTSMGEIKEVLGKYEEYVAKNGYRLVFTLYMGAKIYEANSMPKRSILASPAWAVRLITHPDEATDNAFLATLGHELTHKECSFHEKSQGIHGLMFQRWVLEAYCDFGAGKRLGSREKMLAAIDYKIELKKGQRNYPIHPSWEQRRGYIAEYDFGDELIEKIAADVGCRDRELIGKAEEHYRERHIFLE